jgi:hypothetical protein
MTYQQILEIAEVRLQNKFPYVVTDLRDQIASGSTGGEIMGLVGKYLKNLKKNNSEAYSILENEIVEYLSECKRYGIVVI